MTYQERLGHHSPEKQDQVIWRYMDLAKFLVLIRQSNMYFSRIDAMQDSFEGVMPRGQASQLVKAFETIAIGNPEMIKKVALLPKALGEEYFRRNREALFVSCWHINDDESGAMWKVYGDNSIAIQSTFGRLRDCLDEDSSHKVNIGIVQYVDFEKWSPTDPAMPSVLTKRSLYSFERELRAVIYHIPQTNSDIPHPRGIDMFISLNRLIERVFIGPEKRQWFVDLIRDMLDFNDLGDIPIIRSGMDEKPSFA